MGGTDCRHTHKRVGNVKSRNGAIARYEELSQRLNWLEFVVHFDGSSLFSHRGEDAVIDDASRIRPFWIEWATSESGFGRLFLIVGNLSRSDHRVHTNNNRSLQCIVKDSTK